MRYDRPRFLDQGEAALTVEFGDAVDAKVNARVLALDAALRRETPPGVTETTPTYRSLLIHYEPLEISRAALAEWVESVIASEAKQSRSDAAALDCFVAGAPRNDGGGWIIPCCYDPAVAEDIAEAASLLGLSARALSKTHAGAEYRAYMYGFAPGWCYLGGLPESLAIPRRLAPRGPTPEGAVLIGGGLSLIATNPMPTGWYVVGRTPERLFSLERDPPFLIAPGDALRFEPIDAATFASLDARAAQGEIVARREAPL
ncbi:5-oxoprolinase subunit B family protein [Methylocystis parvus]|uniref:Allophanate hydrolase subunit 1 n=1 Tax=Methylocystis parvus TaxID=134 RepID=A0A6B8M2Q8_9HYPH|nr:allophanate hydrolase subunit 1 [Methylocystis parvus]QGM96648.1 allophanate hydrolase subunit 1 [Methylocystis parvus]WBJ99494.1 allophanate hydrolase subunit 1 [Methylocystis parvus OBBP]